MTSAAAAACSGWAHCDSGAARAVGLDIAAPAVAATRRNAALNGFERQLEATLAPLDEIQGTFDVVVANIGRAALVELAPQLVERLRGTDGWR